jgi:sulfur-oxidizing protein SoxY
MAVAASIPMVLPGLLEAAPKDAKARLSVLTGGVAAKKGRVTIVMPKRTDQKDFVPIKVSVESPMTEEDYVKAIHIVSERNPTPAVASYFLNPNIGKAEISTRIRLLESQVVVAAAEMSDGTVYIGKSRIKIVTGAGGCG